MAVLIGINEMKIITEALSERSGYSFNNFVQSFLKRRLQAFLEKYHIRNIDQFLKQLGSKLFLESLLYFLSVDTTEMFRDPGFWRAIKAKVLNDPILTKNPVWFPDIGSGEELFSFLILLDIIDREHRPEVYFHHPSSSRIDEVRSGMIRSKHIDVHSNNFKRLEIGGKFEDYCHYHSNNVVVSNSVLDNIHPKKGWFLTKPEQHSFGLIFFRNSMLYLNKQLREDVFQFLYNKIAPGGFIVIGIKESIPDSMKNKLLAVDENEKIYRKVAFAGGLGV